MRPVRSLLLPLFLLSSSLPQIAGEPTAATVESPAKAAWMTRPLGVSLEVRTVQSHGAYGAHLVPTLVEGSHSILLAEAYGYEGEARLGVIGGGLIYRHSAARLGFVEANVFFDGLRDFDGFSYPQIGAGLAFTQPWYTLRANGYIPLSGKETREETTRWHRGDASYSRRDALERSPMHGFEVEAEAHLPHPPKWIDPRITVGYSWREADQRPEVFAGLIARAEVRFARHFILDAEWRQDAAGADQEWRVGLRFETLFGGPQEADRPAGWYQQAERFPWPTTARGTAHGHTRGFRPEETASPAAPIPATDCCPGNTPPLIFE